MVEIECLACGKAIKPRQLNELIIMMQKIMMGR
ncbi:MAG: hypothetical protein HW402_1157 [Dehalococcoidales bacterium]|nr:hypothetical protein [Dehalococcoidales bacterium]